MAQDEPTGPVSKNEVGENEVGENEKAKAKFREALERKKAAQHRSQAGSAAAGPVHGSETAGPTQRRFQRKSGSS